MIEPGQYKAINKKHYFVTFDTAKGPMEAFCVEFELQAGKYAGQMISWRGGLRGKGYDYTTKAMIAMGWDEKTNPSIAEMKKEVTLVIEHEVSAKDQKTYAVVKFVNSAEGGGGFRKYAMDEAKTKSFENDFMAMYRQQKASRGENTETGSLESGGSAGKGK